MSGEQGERAGGEQAVEYLQAAALEAIKAVRSFLDIAESLVREPESAAVVGKAFAEAAAAVFRPSTLVEDPHEASEMESDGHAGGVHRIDLSD